MAGAALAAFGAAIGLAAVDVDPDGPRGMQRLDEAMIVSLSTLLLVASAWFCWAVARLSGRGVRLTGTLDGKRLRGDGWTRLLTAIAGGLHAPSTTRPG